MSRSVKFGHGEGSTHISFLFEEDVIELEAGRLTVTEWQGIVNKMEKVLLREGLVAPPQPIAPRSHGSPVKSAPWFLRPWYLKVQSKKEMYD